MFMFKCARIGITLVPKNKQVANAADKIAQDPDLQEVLELVKNKCLKMIIGK